MKQHNHAWLVKEGKLAAELGRSEKTERARMSLKGKVALVTGSTSGIGLGIAEALARQGADIMVNGFGEPGAIAAVCQSIRDKFGVRVAFGGGDISKPDQVAALVAQTGTELGSLDILVNNAGIQYVAPIEEFPIERFDAVIAINLAGVFYAMRAAIPGMKAKGWGRIINIASAHGLVGSPEKVAYVAAKHGVVGMTKVAGLELANDGITVNAICPGWVLTPLVEKQLEARAKIEGKDVASVTYDFLVEKQAMAKFSTAEQIGAMAVYLCSDAASTVTGVPLSIDGGWVAH